MFHYYEDINDLMDRFGVLLSLQRNGIQDLDAEIEAITQHLRDERIIE